MQDAEDRRGGGAVCGDDEGGDLVLLHEGEGVGGEGLRGDGAGRGVHYFRGGFVEGVRAVAFEQAAEIAVGEDAEEFGAGEDGGHAEALGGHLVDDLRHFGGGRDVGERVAGVHELADGGETAAELTAGVKLGEVVGLEVEAAGDVYGESVAEGEHGGGGGGGGELVSAGFAGDADVEGVGAGGGEGGGGTAAETE